MPCRQFLLKLDSLISSFASEVFDRIYRTYFSSADALPARTRIQAGRTPLDCGLEVDAIGFVP